MEKESSTPKRLMFGVVVIALIALAFDLFISWKLGIEPTPPLQTLTLILAVLGGLIAAVKFPIELTENREQRKRELAWRKVEMAKKLNDEMLSDPLVVAAFELMDYPGCKVKLDDESEITASDEEIEQSLAKNRDPKDKIREIRRCFDSVFFYMSMMQHYADQKLIRLEDVAYPLSYYASLMNGKRNLYLDYLRFYGLPEAMKCFRWMVEEHERGRASMNEK